MPNENGERRAHVIAVADRHAAGRDDRVVVHRRCDQRSHRDRIVLRDPDVRRDATGILDQRTERVRRRVDDLAWPRRGADIDELVAGGDHRDTRALDDLERRHAERRE
jgi:hypothetical protein